MSPRGKYLNEEHPTDLQQGINLRWTPLDDVWTPLDDVYTQIIQHGGRHRHNTLRDELRYSW